MISNLKQFKTKVIGNKGVAYTNKQLLARSTMWFIVAITLGISFIVALTANPALVLAWMLRIFAISLILFCAVATFFIIRDVVNNSNNKVMLKSKERK